MIEHAIRYFAGASLAVLAATQPALAQAQQGMDPGAATPAAADPAPATPTAPTATQTSVAPDYAADIIVTAQKREESINRVGLTIAAIGADDLRERQIQSVADLAQAIPGLSYTNSANNTPVYTLRGVGFYDTSLGSYPTTSVYVDQVPLPFPVLTSLTAFDLERIEVLKGPQGTLFGQNSTGGAINYIAAKPTKDFRAGMEASYGRFDDFVGSAYVSGPLSDTLRARIAVRGEKSGPWQQSYTEGWPIALQLTSLSLKRGPAHRRFVGGFRGSSAELARYLSEQVLMSLPEETQEIVTRTALLDRITGEAVDLMCERQDGWAVLERLEQQGVLLTPSDDGEAYRYHHLFAEFLRDRLARHDPVQFRALHRRMAEWHAARGETAEAISHAIEADASGILVAILEDAGGWRLIPHGHQGLAERAMARLPAELVTASPLLALARIYLNVKRGEMATARIDYDRLVVSAGERGASPEILTEIRVVGDVLAEYENVPMTFEDLLEREALLRTLSGDDHLVLANVNESLAAKYHEGGWLERAMEPTLAAREHYQAMGSLYSDLFTRFHEARIRHAQGRLNDAVVILAEARGEIEASFGERSDLAANCAAFEAELLYEQDRAAAATELLDWALPHMEQSDGWVDVYAVAFCTAARIAAGDGAMDEARALLGNARRIADRRGLRQLDLLAAVCEVELEQQHGDRARASALAEDIGLDGFADSVEQESPIYRWVATAAALCRVRAALTHGDATGALAELGTLERWARQHGAGRLLIELNILRAHGHRLAGDTARARQCFDEAIGLAMFQGIIRPFVDARQFVQGQLDEALAAAPSADRFRVQFLKDIARALASRRSGPVSTDLLNEAEATILAHLSQGYSNKEIARLIGMSPDTVKYRLKSVFRKIGVNKRRDAVRVSRERGLIGTETAP